MIEDLGDALWYFANACLRAGLRLSTIAARVPAQLGDWDYHGRGTRDRFAELQNLQTDLTGPLSTDLVERRLLTLEGKVGVLLDDFAADQLHANGDAL